MAVRQYPRMVRFDPPKSNTTAVCRLCGGAKAGFAHVQTSWFRGDDEVVRCCRACFDSRSADDVLAALARKRGG